MRRVLVLPLVLSACAVAGANLNQRTPGNRNGGIVLQLDEIAVDPEGELFIVRQGSELLVGDLTAHTLERLDGVANPRLLAFWARGSGFYAFSMDDPKHPELVSYDLDARQVVWRRQLERAGAQSTRLDVTPDGRRVILTRSYSVALFDALSGSPVGTFESPRAIEDIDITPDGRRLVVTEHEVWQQTGPRTTVRVVSSEAGATLCIAQAPNCADELVLDPEGERAYLAPTFCAADPVSVIDVTEGCRFVKNLPGFGPIALSSDGSMGVAFLDRKVRDPMAPKRPKEVDASNTRYHLMLFDTRTLELHTLPVGAKLPRYALSPDAKTILVDSLENSWVDSDEKSKPKRTWFHLLPGPAHVVDVSTRAKRTIEGPAIMLNAFVFDAPSQHAWLIYSGTYLLDEKTARPVDAGLYTLDFAAAQVEQVPLPFSPIALNRTPDGATLLLRDENQIYLFDMATRQITATFPSP